MATEIDSKFHNCLVSLSPKQITPTLRDTIIMMYDANTDGVKAVTIILSTIGRIVADIKNIKTNDEISILTSTHFYQFILRNVTNKHIFFPFYASLRRD